MTGEMRLAASVAAQGIAYEYELLADALKAERDRPKREIEPGRFEASDYAGAIIAHLEERAVVLRGSTR